MELSKMTGATTANFGPADKAKITHLINSGIDVMREIATLKEGLKDTVTAVADELDLEKKTLNRAIRLAYKKSQNNQNPIEDAQEELDTVEQLLAAAGV
jgi:transposase-like protein